MRKHLVAMHMVREMLEAIVVSLDSKITMKWYFSGISHFNQII